MFAVSTTINSFTHQLYLMLNLNLHDFFDSGNKQQLFIYTNLTSVIFRGAKEAWCLYCRKWIWNENQFLVVSQGYVVCAGNQLRSGRTKIVFRFPTDTRDIPLKRTVQTSCELRQNSYLKSNNCSLPGGKEALRVQLTHARSIFYALRKTLAEFGLHLGNIIFNTRNTKWIRVHIIILTALPACFSE